MRYATYNRVSGDSQVEGTSLDWQREQQVAWGERANWTHVEDIFDGGESGAKLDRAGVQRVIGLLRDERIDLVSFYKVDRAARAQRVFEDLWTAIYALGGKVFIHQKSRVYEDLDALMGDTVWDRAMAEQERYSIQSRTADGILQHLRAGSFVYRPIYGYYTAKVRRGGANVNELRIDNEQARIVQLIVQRTIDGDSYPQVAKLLNERGYLSRRRMPWTSNSVVNILRHRSQYAGLPFVKERKVRDQRHEVTYAYPPILSGETLEELERALKLKPKGPSRGTSPMRGVVRCSRCGNKATVVLVSGKKGLASWSLYCLSYRQAQERRGMGQPVDFDVCGSTVSVSVLTRKLREWLEGGGYERAQKILRARVLAWQAMAEVERRALSRVEGELEEMESRLLRVPVAEFVEVARVLNVQITALQEAREGHRKKALGLESLHTRATAKLGSSPGEPGDLLAALDAEDRVRVNELLHRMGIQAEVDFGEPVRRTRWDSVQFVVRMPVPTDAEQYEGYLVQTS